MHQLLASTEGQVGEMHWPVMHGIFRLSDCAIAYGLKLCEPVNDSIYC